MAMSLRGLFFIGLFGVCSLWALADPFAGVVAYVTHYHSYPERSWWGAGLASLGVRYSYTITACLTVGTILNLGRLPYGRLITRQEALYLAFLGWMLVSRAVSGGMQTATFRGSETGTVDAIDKMLKMAVFVLAMTHVVVTPRQYERFMWVLVACALYLGYEGYTAPGEAYYQGRLNGIGGPDFGDANALGAHMLVLLAIVGVQFLRSGGKGKIFTFVAGGFTANTVVATRSRAAFLAAIVGIIAALILAPKGGRKRLWPLVIMGALGSLVLVDARFMERMRTLKADEREKDESAQSRLRVWKGGMNMIRDHPLMGVGPSNFPAYIGHYVPEEAGRDAHQTYLRCTAELGLLGLILFTFLIVNAFRTLARIRRSVAGWADAEDYTWHTLAIQLSLIMYLIC
jgi:O-antigen ligase